MTYSVYCAYLFGDLCAAGRGRDNSERWNLTSTISCSMDKEESSEVWIKKKQYNIWSIHLKGKVETVETTFVMLVAFLCLYMFREFLKMWISCRVYWRELDSYRNLLILLLVFLTLHKHQIGRSGFEEGFQRWNYHLASLSCLLTWIEMMYLMGKVPRFGRYIQMFWLVLK